VQSKVEFVERVDNAATKANGGEEDMPEVFVRLGKFKKTDQDRGSAFLTPKEIEDRLQVKGREGMHDELAKVRHRGRVSRWGARDKSPR
jgi:hypothetical protein